MGKRREGISSNFTACVPRRGYIEIVRQRKLAVISLFSIGQKEGFFEGFFFIPSFLFVLYRTRFSSIPVTP